MAKRFIGYCKPNQDTPGVPVAISGEIDFKDWEKLTGAYVNYTLQIGERYFYFSKDELVALGKAVEAALADEERLIDTEVKRVSAYTAKIKGSNVGSV